MELCGNARARDRLGDRVGRRGGHGPPVARAPPGERGGFQPQIPSSIFGHPENPNDSYTLTRACRKDTYHPLGVLLGETGHWLDLELRPGNVHTANGAKEMLVPLIERARVEPSDNVRGDAAENQFRIGPEILAMLDEQEAHYALRYPINSDLRAWQEIQAVRPPGRPPGYERTWCHDIEYRTLTWQKPRRVLLNTFRSLAGASEFIDEAPELSLQRARRLLLIAGRVVVSARRATLIIMDAAHEAWSRAWERIRALHPPLTAA